MVDTLTELQDHLREFLKRLCTRECLRSCLVEELNDWGEASHRQFADLFVTPLREFGMFDLINDSDISSVSLLSSVAFESGYSLLPLPLTDYLFWGPYLVCRSQSAVSTLGISEIEKIKSGEVLICGTRQQDEVTSLGLPLSSYVVTPVNTNSGEEKQFSITVLKELSFSRTFTCDPLALTGALPFPREVTNNLRCRGLLDDQLLFYDVLLVIQSLGAAKRAFDDTLSYLKTRVQFGVPVGGFQAVQQKVASQFSHLEALAAFSKQVVSLFEFSNLQFHLGAHALVAKARSHLTSIIEAMIQCQGGIGFTWEADVHLSLRRVHLLLSLIPNSTGSAQGIFAHLP